MGDQINPDGRPTVQILYDELWETLEKYGSSGLTNAELIGTLEIIKNEQLMQMCKCPKKE